MVFARNAAMGFNRWADRRIDAENPRTAGREIPAGKIPARHALWFVAVNALLFILTAATINRLAAILSPVALSVIPRLQLLQALHAAGAPRAGAFARHRPVGLLSPWPGTSSSTGTSSSNRSSLAPAGDDLVRRLRHHLHALQDAEFDRRHGLHSIPARFRRVRRWASAAACMR